MKPRGGRLSAALAAPLAAAAAGLAARTAYSVLKKYPPGGAKTWHRTNHRGEPVTLLEGPAVALGAMAVQFFNLEPLHPERTVATHVRQSIALAGAGALGFGVLDDLAGSGKRRGLRGHLGALAHGEVTTGAVKLAGIGATGVGSALLMGGQPADVVINSGLIAAGANLLNLFDLRPGRAIKVATASATLIAVSAWSTTLTTINSAASGSPRTPKIPSATRASGVAVVAAPLGAALALLPADLGERAMLGDAGANALGAMLGAAAASCLPRPARVALLAGMVALTAASEKISFTKVIERTPPLRWLDMLGRRPAATAP